MNKAKEMLDLIVLNTEVGDTDINVECVAYGNGDDYQYTITYDEGFYEEDFQDMVRVIESFLESKDAYYTVVDEAPSNTLLVYVQPKAADEATTEMYAEDSIDCGDYKYEVDKVVCKIECLTALVEEKRKEDLDKLISITDRYLEGGVDYRTYQCEVKEIQRKINKLVESVQDKMDAYIEQTTSETEMYISGDVDYRTYQYEIERIICNIDSLIKTVQDGKKAHLSPTHIRPETIKDKIEREVQDITTELLLQTETYVKGDWEHRNYRWELETIVCRLANLVDELKAQEKREVDERIGMEE